MNPIRNLRARGYRIGLAFWLAVVAALVPRSGLTASPVSVPQGGGPFLYSISPRDNILRVVDPGTMATQGAVMVRLPGETIEGGTGLAAHPTTGELYAVLKLEGSTTQRELVRINPSTGLATTIGNTGDNFSALAFSSNGTLYGVTGDGGTITETLFTISLTNAATSLVRALGNGDDGEIIAYNPDDGLMYHASGRNGLNGPDNRIFESINLQSTAVTTITLPPGTPDEEVAAMIYQGGGNFLYMDIDYIWYSLSTAGTVVTLTTDIDHESHGLAYSNLGPPASAGCGPSGWYGVANANPGDGTLYSLDPASGLAHWIGPIGYDNVTSLAYSAAGELYGVGEDVSGTLTLLNINRCTGQGTPVNPLGTVFSAYTDAAFRHADDVLFGYVTNPNQTLVTITVQSGVVITVGVTGLIDGGNGLAFASTDTLYHADDAALHTLDQSSGSSLTTVPLTATTPFVAGFVVEALEFGPADVLYAVVRSPTNGDDEVYLATIDTTSGVITSVGQSVSRLDALAYAPLNRLFLPVALR